MRTEPRAESDGDYNDSLVTFEINQESARGWSTTLVPSAVLSNLSVFFIPPLLGPSQTVCLVDEVQVRYGQKLTGGKQLSNEGALDQIFLIFWDLLYLFTLFCQRNVEITPFCGATEELRSETYLPSKIIIIIIMWLRTKTSPRDYLSRICAFV